MTLRGANLLTRSHRARAAACAILALSLPLAGCGGEPSHVARYDAARFGAPDADTIPPPAADRKLAVGDVITVRVYRVDSFTGDQTIDGSGLINLPIVGYVPAVGRTTAELEAQLTQLLGAKYLVSPVVSVALKTPVVKTVTVDGSVQQPGIYPMQENTTLIKTIAMAHGISDDANPRRVVIFRQINGQRMAASFDLKSIRRGNAPDPQVYANDTVIVDGSALTKAFKTVLQSLPLVSTFRPL